MREGILRINDGLEIILEDSMIKLQGGVWLDVKILGSWVSGYIKKQGHDCWVIELSNQIEMPIGSGMKARIE